MEKGRNAAMSLGHAFIDSSIRLGREEDNPAAEAIRYPVLCVRVDNQLRLNATELLKFSENKNGANSERAKKMGEMLLEIYGIYLAETVQTEKEVRDAKDFKEMMSTAQDHAERWDSLGNGLMVFAVDPNFEMLSAGLLQKLKRT